MGSTRVMKRYRAPDPRPVPPAPAGLRRRRPRDFVEWETLRRWERLPSWELDPPGYLLRLAREDAGLTQRSLGERLGVTQQAVAQAERWDANPTAALMRRWAEACGARLEIRFTRPDRA